MSFRVFVLMMVLDLATSGGPRVVKFLLQFLVEITTLSQSVRECNGRPYYGLVKQSGSKLPGISSINFKKRLFMKRVTDLL